MVLAKRGSRLMVMTPVLSEPEPKSSIQFSGDCTPYVPTLCVAPALTAAPSVPVQNRLPETSTEHSPPKVEPTTSRARSLGLVESLLVRDNVGWLGSTLVFEAMMASPAPALETSTSHPGSLPSKSENPEKKLTPARVGTTEVSIASVGVCPPVEVMPLPAVMPNTPAFFRVTAPPKATTPPPLSPDPAETVREGCCNMALVTPAAGIFKLSVPLVPPPLSPLPVAVVMPVMVPVPALEQFQTVPLYCRI